MLLDIKEIREYLPHRYPFLLVDRVVELKVEKWVKAIKNAVSYTHLTLPTMFEV